MRIYTKTGDSGQTSLIGGRRVAKNHPRVEAYGQVDELVAAIGVVRAYLEGSGFFDRLPLIQERLMMLSAHLACDGNTGRLPDVGEDIVADLEREIDQMQEQLPPISSFVLPGPPVAAAYCHVARTVCRRAERAVVALGGDASVRVVAVYLNRLSDFLFVLGRFVGGR